jgi:ketopantoate reductase
MKICIIGAGAIGGLPGAHLAQTRLGLDRIGAPDDR